MVSDDCDEWLLDVAVGDGVMYMPLLSFYICY